MHKILSEWFYVTFRVTPGMQLMAKQACTDAVSFDSYKIVRDYAILLAWNNHNPNKKFSQSIFDLHVVSLANISVLNTKRTVISIQEQVLNR